MASSVFDFFFTGTGAIRRPAPIVAGKRSTAPATLTVIKCSALVGVTDDEARRQLKRPELETPLEIAQVFTGSAVMAFSRKGDDLILGSRAYPIRHIEFWPVFNIETGCRIIVEKVDN